MPNDLIFVKKKRKKGENCLNVGICAIKAAG